MTAVRLLAAALGTAALAAAYAGPLGAGSPWLAVVTATAGFPLLAGLAARSRPGHRHG